MPSPIGFRRRAAVWLLAFSPPLLGNAFLVFPELPALLACLAMWAAFGGGRDRGWTLAAVAGALLMLYAAAEPESAVERPTRAEKA